MILKNNIALIGDFINTIPLMEELAKKEPIKVIYNQEAKHLYDLINPSVKVELIEEGEEDIEIDINRAFAIACQSNLHMTQAYFGAVNMPIPDKPIKPNIVWPKEECEFVDFIISPFSRSLPVNQLLWPHQWFEIINHFKDRKILLLGNSKHDDPSMFFGFKNVEVFFDHPLGEVLNRMSNCRALISVVTGTSHLSYPVGCKNILLTKQRKSGWGINPEAICIENFETDLIIKTLENEL